MVLLIESQERIIICFTVPLTFFTVTFSISNLQWVFITTADLPRRFHVLYLSAIRKAAFKNVVIVMNLKMIRHFKTKFTKKFDRNPITKQLIIICSSFVEIWIKSIGWIQSDTMFWIYHKLYFYTQYIYIELNTLR